MSPARGTYAFEITHSGALVDNAANRGRLTKLFRDADIIEGDWGPGDPGDFDNGSWHILCHLAGGTGVFETAAGRAWCAITHVPASDTYQATVTHNPPASRTISTVPLTSSVAAALLAGAHCLGFIEGSSQGHILARGVADAPTAFNHWPRQMFDKDVHSLDDGGTVWEHWSTTRDIRETGAIGTSVLTAWLTLISHLGGRFVAAVARGRRDHGHPRQLVALVRAGVLTAEEATWDVTPDAIPGPAQDLLYEARPADALIAAEQLPFASGKQKYYMFTRRIGNWSSSEKVLRDLETV